MMDVTISEYIFSFCSLLRKISVAPSLRIIKTSEVYNSINFFEYYYFKSFSTKEEYEMIGNNIFSLI